MRNALVPALVLATAALAAGPDAHAQQGRSGGAVAGQSAAPSGRADGEAPWYERFTFGSQSGSGPAARVPRAEPRASVRVAPQSRWSVSVGEDDQVAARLAPGAAARLPAASAGVSYDVSPRARVGAAVTLPVRPAGEADRDLRSNRRSQAEPGVKVESAFRF